MSQELSTLLVISSLGLSFCLTGVFLSAFVIVKSRLSGDRFNALKSGIAELSMTLWLWGSIILIIKIARAHV